MKSLGLDKTTLCNLKIIKADFEKLRQSEKVTVTFGSTKGTITALDINTNQEIEFTSILIKDNTYFIDLRADIAPGSTTAPTTPFINLSLKVNNNDTHNLYSYDIEHYKDNLEFVIDYIHLNYGIVLDTSSVELKSLEYACTFSLKNSFTSYKRFLLTLSRLCPPRFDATPYDKNKTFTGITIGNDSLTCKIYNKSHQLNTEHQLNLTTDIMRIELTLKKQTAINYYLHTCDLTNLTDELLLQVFLQLINRILIDPFKKYLLHTEKAILLEAKRQRKQFPIGNKDYIAATFAAISDDITLEPKLFDYTQLYSVIATIEQGNKNKNRALSYVKDLTPNHYINQLELANEILNVLESLSLNFTSKTEE